MAGRRSSVENMWQSSMNEEPQVDVILDIEKAFQRGLKAIRKKIENIENTIAEGKTYTKIREQGELLKCNLHLLKKGESKLEVENFFTNPVTFITITLDPLKSASENLDDYFSKAKNLENSISIQETRLEEALVKKKEIESIIATFVSQKDAAWGMKQLEVLGFKKFLPIVPVKKEIIKLSPLEKAVSKIKKFYSCDGFWIYVGGDANENEIVSFRIASGKDPWMHVANVPGSHVAVKLNHKGDEVPRSTILEAAMLAVHFSKYRNRSNVQVTVTEACNVKKAKGQPVGTVYAHFTKQIKVSDSKELLNIIIDRTNKKKCE